MLKIITKNEPIIINQICLTIYGQPGIGKTTLAETSLCPLLLDFDQGSYRAKNRKDVIFVKDWTDVASISKDDIKLYDTIILDTVGRALDFLAVDIIRRNPKLGYSGVLTLQGYGQLKAQFTAWLNWIKNLGKDIVLLAHLNEDKKGDDIIERLDIQGGSKNEIHKISDAMGCCTLMGGKRVLNFSPSDTRFGKNPAQFMPLTIPDVNDESLFLSNIIDTIKETLNSTTNADNEQSTIKSWAEKIRKAQMVDDFNQLLDESNTITKSEFKTAILKKLHEAAINLGFVFKKEVGYVQE